MRDVNDRNALRLQTRNQLEQRGRFCIRQTRRWLIHNQDSSFFGKCFRNLSQLPSARAQLADQASRINLHAHLGKNISRLTNGFAVIQKTNTRSWLSGQENILRHRQRRHEAELLKNHGDAVVFRVRC